MGQMPVDKRMPRRQFLSLATWAIGGLIGLAYAIPGFAYLISPALQKGTQKNWIPLGSTSKVELGTPTLFRATIERRAGWIVSQEEISAYVLTEDGRDFIAMSNVCTHLGCRVRWIGDEDRFFCPCHNGVYDRQGNVVSGPPPRPLDRFDIQVDGGEIQVLGG
jgi:menaquinol-cytochrome c reductase iron-sulfur subunit